MINTINRIIDTLSRLCNSSIITQSGVIALAFLSNFFLPILPVVLTCFGISMIDLYYGLKIAKKSGCIESRRAWEGTITKMKDVLIVLSAARGIELYILSSLVSGVVLVGGIATIVAVTEVWSILENLNTLDPDGPWRVLSRFMKKKGEDVIGMDIEELTKK